MRKLLIILALLLSACTRESDVEKYAKIEGWQSYQTTGYGWFACGKDDVFATSFKAIKNGQEISGTVCSGWFKGKTLRLD